MENKSSSESMFLMRLASIACLIVWSWYLSLSRHKWLEAEGLFVAGATAGAATNAAVWIGYAAEHLCRFLFIDLLWRQDAMSTDLHAATATDALVVIDRFDEARGPFLSATSKTGNICHFVASSVLRVRGTRPPELDAGRGLDFDYV
jgi:hypothetical protein